MNFWRENGGGFVGNGCVCEVFSPGMSDLRHRAFFDRPDRLSGFAIEDPDETLFADLRDDVDCLPS